MRVLQRSCNPDARFHSAIGILSDPVSHHCGNLSYSHSGLYGELDIRICVREREREHAHKRERVSVCM